MFFLVKYCLVCNNLFEGTTDVASGLEKSFIETVRTHVCIVNPTKNVGALAPLFFATRPKRSGVCDYTTGHARKSQGHFSI